jgi:hypothetical protein
VPALVASRAFAATVAVIVHLLILAPLAGRGSPIVEEGFRPEAEAVLDGAEPYSGRDFEYPPLALPLIAGPALVTDDADGYGEAFAWEMIGFDLALVLMLALGLGGSPPRRWAALGVFTLGIGLLTGGSFLPDSAIEAAALPLARFDLAVAALVLAAVLAREAARSAIWSASLATGTAVKAVPALLYPFLLRGERRLARVGIATAVPLVGAVALVLALGDQFWSAIDYHAGRELQVESLAASPFLLADVLGAEVATETGAGSWNVVADGAELARIGSLVALAGLFVLVVRQAWLRRTPMLDAATAGLAVAVVLAPVLSPQFLLWLLPLSAAAYGARSPNLVLLAAFAVTMYVLNYYGGVEPLEERFALAVAARNALLLAYLALVLAPVLRRRPEPCPP